MASAVTSPTSMRSWSPIRTTPGSQRTSIVRPRLFHVSHGPTPLSTMSNATYAYVPSLGGSKMIPPQRSSMTTNARPTAATPVAARARSAWSLFVTTRAITVKA